MKKTVNFKGEKVKIDFKKDKYAKVVDRMYMGSIAECHGSEDFIINNKPYSVNFRMIRNNRHYVCTYSFESFECNDSEKKVIEFIIDKYGL